MAKIMVPQELQDQIIDLYVNKGRNRKQVKSDLNLPFSDSVIKRILEEHNVEIRSNPGAKAGGRKKDKVDRDVELKIVELYKQGYGITKIQRTYLPDYSFDKIKRILKDNNVQIRTMQEAHALADKPELRKYTVNDDYVLESHNGAWLLGMYASDGYLPKTAGAHNRLTLSLQRRDKDVLEMIKQELNYTGPIYDYESTNGYPESSLSFASYKLRRQFESYGIVNNKTFKLHELPKLPNEFMMDYIRGYFDGDGSLYEQTGTKKVVMSFTGASKPFLQEIAEYLNRACGVKIPRVNEVERKHIIYDIRYYKHDSLILCKEFYDNDYIALPRKKNHALEVLAKYGH